MKLSGYVCVRNGFLLDYCFEEAIQSMIPVCDEVVVSVGLKDGEEDDGTYRKACEWADRDSRVRVVIYPWNNPQRDLGWWVQWLNWTRNRLSHGMQFTLDADEVLDPRSHDRVRWLAKNGERAYFKRQNYWRDPKHLAPHNRACGYLVARLGPTALYMPSDEPHPAVEHNVRKGAKVHDELVIHHFGFLRKPDAFLRKSDVVQKAFFGANDERLIKHEQAGTDWRQDDYFDGLSLEDAKEPIPELMMPWLRERGYDV